MTWIVEMVIGIAALLIWRMLKPYIEAKTSEQQRARVAQWVDIAVQAAEQLFGPNKGPEKKEQVVAFLQEKGCSISNDELDVMIEAAVYSLKQHT